MRGRHGRRTEETVLSQPGWAGHGPPGIQVEVTEEEEEEAVGGEGEGTQI